MSENCPTVFNLREKHGRIGDTHRIRVAAGDFLDLDSCALPTPVPAAENRAFRSNK